MKFKGGKGLASAAGLILAYDLKVFGIFLIGELAIGLTTNYIDVWAYDTEDGLNKLFKVSRIDWVDSIQQSWIHEDEHRKGYLDVFRMQSFEQTHVRLEMNSRAKSLLCEEYPMAIPVIKEENDRWILDTMVSAMEGVGRFVIGLAADIKVIDSPELEEYIKKYVSENLSSFTTKR